MNYDELINILSTSSRSDWNPLDCANGGSCYHEQFSFWEKYDGQKNVLKCDHHTGYAVYEEDISLTIAFGVVVTDDWHESWSDVFPNKKASFNLVDVFYNGALVYRSNYICVDGGRCNLPLPLSSNDLRVNQLQNNLSKLIDELSGCNDFETYFKRAGFSLVK
ncbi:hypothetical protein K9N50_07070 [bacterium]|nr:hypothetical protein [bacterium]